MDNCALSAICIFNVIADEFVHHRAKEQKKGTCTSRFISKDIYSSKGGLATTITAVHYTTLTAILRLCNK